jgi:hypothetical protein
MIRPDNISSDVESLMNGIIKLSNNKANAPHTILLLGVTGVGKSSFLEFIANVLSGNNADHYNFKILDRFNEQGGSNNQSLTRSARLYEITGMNGMVVSAGVFERGEYAYPPPKVRILVTSGFTNTGRPQQDALQNESIANQIKSYIDPVTAVLVLVGGTVPRGIRGLTVPDALKGVPVGTDSALSSLSAIFPKNPTNSVDFLLTDVSSPLYQTFSGETVPDALKGAPQVLLNNPVAPQKKYSKLKGGPHVRHGATDPRDTVKSDENHTLEMLVEFFDWLDSLGPQPTTEKLVPPQYISAWMDQVTPRKAQSSAIFASYGGMAQQIFGANLRVPVENEAAVRMKEEMLAQQRAIEEDRIRMQAIAAEERRLAERRETECIRLAAEEAEPIRKEDEHLCLEKEAEAHGKAEEEAERKKLDEERECQERWEREEAEMFRWLLVEKQRMDEERLAQTEATRDEVHMEFQRQKAEFEAAAAVAQLDAEEAARKREREPQKQRDAEFAKVIAEETQDPPPAPAPATPRQAVDAGSVQVHAPLPTYEELDSGRLSPPAPAPVRHSPSPRSRVFPLPPTPAIVPVPQPSYREPFQPPPMGHPSGPSSSDGARTPLRRSPIRQPMKLPPENPAFRTVSPPMNGHIHGSESIDHTQTQHRPPSLNRNAISLGGANPGRAPPPRFGGFNSHQPRTSPPLHLTPVPVGARRTPRPVSIVGPKVSSASAALSQPLYPSAVPTPGRGHGSGLFSGWLISATPATSAGQPSAGYGEPYLLPGRIDTLMWDSDIEQEAPPPVSSLRSRFEALAAQQSGSAGKFPVANSNNGPSKTTSSFLSSGVGSRSTRNAGAVRWRGNSSHPAIPSTSPLVGENLPTPTVIAHEVAEPSRRIVSTPIHIPKNSVTRSSSNPAPPPHRIPSPPHANGIQDYHQRTLSNFPKAKIRSTARLSTAPASTSHSTNDTSAEGTSKAGVLPPPKRTITPGDALPPRRERSSSGSESDGDETGMSSISTFGSFASTLRKPSDDLPDSTHPNRHPPYIDSYSSRQIHVPAHAGVVAVAGLYCVTAGDHTLTIHNLAQERSTDPPVIIDLNKDVGLEWKFDKPRVTAMDFCPTPGSSMGGGQEEVCRYLWCGTRDGHLFEVDVWSGVVTDFRAGAHTVGVQYIFRSGKWVLSVDENGKVLMFDLSSSTGHRLGMGTMTPRVARIVDRQGFARVLRGRMWTSNGSGSSTAASTHGSTSSGVPAKGPVVRIYYITEEGLSMRSIIVQDPVGAVTSGTVLSSTPGMVYLGHEGGWVTIWIEGGDTPTHIGTVKISVTDVLALEGAGSRLWAGNRKGMVYAYDVKTKPWTVTNSWRAHGELPVTRLTVDTVAITQVSREVLVVVEVR